MKSKHWMMQKLQELIHIRNSLRHKATVPENRWAEVCAQIDILREVLELPRFWEKEAQ